MQRRRVHVIAKNNRTGVQPRAKTTDVRTMARMRRWSLAGEVRKRSPLSKDFPRSVVHKTSLFAAPIDGFENDFCATLRRGEFPEPAELTPQ